jgi:branched-chain amino acid transport system ATP-binding protein
VLSAEGLHLAWGLTEIVHGVSIRVAPGELLAVFGRNGVGKTTLLRGVAGLGPRMTQGNLILGGADAGRWSASKRAQQGLVYVPDEGAVFGTLTVEENLQLARAERGTSRGKRGSREWLDEAFQLFPALADRRRQRGSSLSGGERRMLGIARSVLQRPRVLLFDEPTEGLHPRVFEPIVDALIELRRNGNVGIVWVDRRVELALQIADSYAVIDKGKIVQEGVGELRAASEVMSRMAL